MSLLYGQAAAGADGWRPDTAQSEVSRGKAARSVAQAADAVPRAAATPATKAMNRMIDHLVERKAVLTKMFSAVDLDGSGEIDMDELNAALITLGLRLSQEELYGIMARLDSDGSGGIDLAEFMEHFRREQKHRFEGHIPELKVAKQELLKKLRSHAPLTVDGGAGLYRMLVQIEQLQALNRLTPDQVEALRAQIKVMIQTGDFTGEMRVRDDLQSTLRQHALPQFNQSAKFSTGKWDEKRPRPWKIGSHEISGPKMSLHRTRKRLTTAEWEKRSALGKTAELSEGARMHRKLPKQKWDTRQTVHSFATPAGETSTVNGKARPRNAEWTKVGLLEAEPKPKPKPQTVKLDESSGGASESASSKPRRRKKRGSKGSGSPQLSPSRSLPSLPSPPDGTGRPPLGMAPVEREPEPWSIAAERSSQEQEDEEAKMLATDQAMKEFAYGTGMIDGSSAASAMSWGADEPAPEPELGYDGYPKGSSVRQGRVALEPPMPVLLQSRPPPPVPRLDLSSTFNSTFDAFKGSTLNSLDASMDLGEMGASRLMPSEIGRATMENAYRGKFPVGERGPFNEFAQVSQVVRPDIIGDPPPTSGLEVDRFLRFGVRPDNWKQATQTVGGEAKMRWSTGPGNWANVTSGAHGDMAGGCWLE